MEGVLVIDKPRGWTSHDVVAKMRRLLKQQRIGHAGTLDPSATGVLVLCLGRAARLSAYLAAADKEYLGQMRLGLATDTYDAEGKPITEHVKPAVSAEQLRALFADFEGEIIQNPPPYSAQKVAGRRLYQYARRGLAVEGRPKRVTIKRLSLLEFDGEAARFAVECSSGTYVRSLVHDIGRRLGCGAHLVWLRRTRSGQFTLEHAVSMDEMHDGQHYARAVVPVDALLPEMPALHLPPSLVEAVAHGRDLCLPQPVVQAAQQAQNFRLLDQTGHLIAIAEKKGTKNIHPKVVLI